MSIDLISIAYAATVAAGGILGYVKAGSLPSLAMGVASGALMGVGAYQTSKDPTNVTLSLATSAMLTGIMGYRFIGSGKLMPAGLVASLSLLMVVRFGYRMYSQGSSEEVYTAELTALVQALELVRKSRQRRFLVFSDSLSALEAIAGRNIGHPLLLEFHDISTRLTSRGFHITLAWVPGHVGIRGNEAVDRLAKDAVRDPIEPNTVPYTDLKPKTLSYTKRLWQQEWNEQSDNKLFQIRPDLKDVLPSSGGNRREETVLTRLHTGHSLLTHGHIFTREEAPRCASCGERVTIKHLMLDCRGIQDIRHKHFTADSMKTLF